MNTPPAAPAGFAGVAGSPSHSSDYEQRLNGDGVGGGAGGVKRRWPRTAALDVAREVCSVLKPTCRRIVVAGSLRRRKADVGDVEILYIPRFEERAVDMFSSAPVNLADEVIESLLAAGVLAKRASKTGAFAWGAKNKLALHRSGLPVDLFAATESNWWNYLVCRTGPAESNTEIATIAQRRGYKWNPYGDGFTRLSDGEIIPMNSEAEVFAFVGLAMPDAAGRAAGAGVGRTASPTEAKENVERIHGGAGQSKQPETPTPLDGASC